MCSGKSGVSRRAQTGNTSSTERSRGANRGAYNLQKPIPAPFVDTLLPSFYLDFRILELKSTHGSRIQTETTRSHQAGSAR